MKTYSMDLRERVVAAYDAKRGTQAEIASLFKVSVSWLQKLLRLRRSPGSIAPKPHGGGREAKFSSAHLEALRNDVEARPDASLEELLICSKVKGSIMAVQRALVRLGCRRKKIAACCRAGSPRCDRRSCGVEAQDRKRGSLLFYLH